MVYDSDLALLRATLASLGRAILYARSRYALKQATVWLVDNGSPDTAAVDRVLLEELEPLEDLDVEVIRGHGNIGFGRGHNLAICRTQSDYHLVLNPDVVLDEAGLLHALQFMDVNSDVGLLTPWASDERGFQQYLCRQYPSLWVLFLRGFAPQILRQRWKHLLAAYEMQDLIGGTVVTGIPWVSGCFMFLRRNVLERVGGFSEQYFLYWEDADLSLRLAREAMIAYVPSVRIVHSGGYAARKGVRHILLFTRSALTFFRTHRWKLT